MSNPVNDLLTVYEEHGTIIVGVDFDDTIFPYNKRSKTQCETVREVLLQARPYITICLYTIADEQSLKYKLALMEMWGLTPDYVNESPVKMSGPKPYFNLLLDDKAGLFEATSTLRKFKNMIND